MTIHLNIFGNRYDDGEPCFLTTEQGVRVWDRVKHRFLNWQSLLDLQAENGHVWANREVGIPSIMWQLGHWNGQRYAPGLDDTSGLASELVTNGDAWTGAPVGSPANTPPTGWTAQNAGTMFQNFSGILDIRPDPVLGGGMTQVLTGTPGEIYVAELIYTLDQSNGVAVTLEGYTLPLGGVPDGDNSEISAFSFTMPASGTVTIGITVGPGANAALDHIRVFLESELTGSGGGQINVPVHGPFMADGAKYWVRSTDCMVGFDLDDSGTPDDWHTGEEVCASTISQASKDGISDTLQMYGCEALSCAGVKVVKKKATKSKVKKAKMN